MRTKMASNKVVLEQRKTVAISTTTNNLCECNSTCEGEKGAGEYGIGVCCIGGNSGVCVQRCMHARMPSHFIDGESFGDAYCCQSLVVMMMVVATVMAMAVVIAMVITKVMA